MAKRLGDQADYQTFMARAQSWQNLYDHAITGVNGRNKSGFIRSTSRAAISSANNADFSQGSDYQYSWNAPQDVAEMIAKHGGSAASEAQLDQFFSNFDPSSPNHILAGGSATQTVNPGHSSQYAYMTNEIDSQVPEVYNWLGRPDRTADVNQEIRDTLWTDNNADGIFGNDDLGATSAWYVWSSLGLFPAVYGTADLVVSGPTFTSVKITSTGGSGRTYTINAPDASHANKYVTGLSVDGASQTANWLPESFAQNGGTLDFTMASSPNDWGTAAADVPPSFDDGTNAYNNIGVTTKGHGGQGSFDGSENTLPAEQVPAPGATVTLPGYANVTYTWPNVPVATADNWVTHGQVIDMGDQRMSSISFLGGATNGPSQGTASINYTDGTTQVVNVALDDWTSPGLASGANIVVATLTGRNNRGGTQDTVKTYIWGSKPVAVNPAKEIASITLPISLDKGVMHVFAIGGAPATPAALTVTGTATDSPDSRVEGGVLAQFSGGDGGKAGDYTATVDWGDGSATTDGTVLSADNSGTYSVFGQHLYPAAGPYTINVTVDDGTTTQSATSTVTVS